MISLYCFDFADFANPRGHREHFEDEFKKHIANRKLEFRISALGGARFIRGIVACDPDSIVSERSRLIDWSKQQPIKFQARFGAPETETLQTDYFRDVSELTLEIDNLSESDNSAAADERQKMIARIEKATGGRTGDQKSKPN